MDTMDTKEAQIFWGLVSFVSFVVAQGLYAELKIAR